jgi:M6 family metalloprotease-like protein
VKNHLFINKILFSVFLIGFFSAEIHALPPPRPSLIDPYTMTFRTSGQPLPIFPKEVRTYRRSPLGGKYPLRRRNVTTFGDGARPLAVDTKTENSVRPLVLLIDFDDRPSSASPSISDPSVFTNLYFGAGVTDLSLKNYWEEVSYGTFTAIGSSADIVGWLRAGTDFPTTITSSAQISGVQVTNVRQLLADAISQLEGTGFDFTPYVRPSDNTFQAVIIHHTGYGQEDTGAVVDPYSHTAQIAPIVTAQGDIADYVIVPSLQSPFDPALRDPAVDPLIGIGVIVHEMGHLFGLPDLYPTGTFGQVGDPFSGVGIFDLMGYGLWGSNLLPVSGSGQGVLQHPGRPHAIFPRRKSGGVKFPGKLSLRPVPSRGGDRDLAGRRGGHQQPTPDQYREFEPGFQGVVRQGSGRRERHGPLVRRGDESQ